jgi:hypothetical protein
LKISEVSLLSLFIWAFILFQDLINWPILQFAEVVSPIKYRDTFWVLADADCYKTLGDGIYGLQSDTGCPGYLYGSPLLQVLNIFRFNQNDTEIFVHGMRIFFVVALAMLILEMTKTFKGRFAITVLVIVSPGVQLMLYNGNFDLLIFALVVYSFFLIKKDQIVFALLLIALSAVFKFYTIPLLLLLTILLPKAVHKLMAFSLLLLSTFSAVRDLQKMQEPIPSSGYAQFGMSIFEKYLEELGVVISRAEGIILSLSLFLFTIVFMFLLTRKVSGKTNEAGFKNQLMFLLIGTVFISCFITGLSYDPRLIYLSIASFILLQNIQNNRQRHFLQLLIVIASFLSCGVELGLIPQNNTGFHPLRFVQLVNDLAIQVLASLIFIALARWFIGFVNTRSQSRNYKAASGFSE